MDAVQLGPLLLPMMLMVVLAAGAAALAIGGWLGKRRGVRASDELGLVLLAGLVIARVAFVLEYRTLYFSAPLSIIDIRDGGWNPAVGLVGAWLFAIHRGRLKPTLRKPVQVGLAGGTVLFLAGLLAVTLRPGTERQVPELAFRSVDGNAVQLAALQGKPLVVNLWATWCGPCQREMPALQEAQRTRPDVNFVFLNQGEDTAKVQAWLRGQGLSLDNVLIDPLRQASATFKQQGYPTTLFFDASGRQVASHIGALSPATIADKLQRSTR